MTEERSMDAQPTDSQIQQAVSFLRQATSILCITGAGVSADSGLPTYRGTGGLYDQEATEDGFEIEDILSGQMLKSRPELTWKYLGEILSAARGTTYNRAHQVLAEMERHFERFCLLTQNVDGFHRLAGSRNVIEIHGNIRTLTCMQCHTGVDLEDRPDIELPPRCPQCNSIMRPDVVLFGEMLPQQAVEELYRQCEQGVDLVISVGTTSNFPYISEPVRMASQTGVPTIEINPDRTLVSGLVDLQIRMRAAEALHQIWNAFQHHPN